MSGNHDRPVVTNTQLGSAQFLDYLINLIMRVSTILAGKGREYISTSDQKNI